MTDADLNKAIEVAEEAVAGFADDDSFEQLLALAVLELRERLDTERVTVADWFMHRGFATGHGDAIVDMLDELEWQVAEREREACALIADKSHRIFRDTKDAHDRNSPNSEPFNPNAFGFSVYAIEESLRITSAIRARGQE
jgi:hypothetical protein